MESNWTIANEGPWQLIYDNSIIALIESGGLISTEANIFTGTKEECLLEIDRLGMPWISEEARKMGLGVVDIESPKDLIYRLIYDESDLSIKYFDLKEEDLRLPNGTEFLGTKEECEAQIVFLNLKRF